MVSIIITGTVFSVTVTRFHSASFSTYTQFHSSLLESSRPVPVFVAQAFLRTRPEMIGSAAHAMNARCVGAPSRHGASSSTGTGYPALHLCSTSRSNPSTFPLPLRSHSVLPLQARRGGRGGSTSLRRRGYLKERTMTAGAVSLLIALHWQSPSSCREESEPLLPPTPGPRSPFCCCCTMCSSGRSESQSAC
jgi:hypothetical protein